MCGRSDDPSQHDRAAQLAPGELAAITEAYGRESRRTSRPCRQCGKRLVYRATRYAWAHVTPGADHAPAP